MQPVIGPQYKEVSQFENQSSLVDTKNVIKQMKQVRFTCKMESFQEDVFGAVSIDEDVNNFITDPVLTLDLKDLVEYVVEALVSTK